MRNEITSDTVSVKAKKKNNIFTHILRKNRQKSSDIWKGIWLLVNTRAPKSSNIKLMDDQNNLISDPQKIVNIFNDHFSTVGSNVDRKIPCVPGSYKSYLSKKDINNKPFLDPPCSFFLTPVIPLEFAKIIDSLDLKKSTPLSFKIL